MKIVVIGGDGFCGWPTSLELVSRGHEVLILDNLSRRAIDVELNTSSLTPIASLSARVQAAASLGRLAYEEINIATEPSRLRDVLGKFDPETIVHFGEQRAAPYSMLGETQRRYTVDNNVTGTHNLLSAIVETNRDIHLVHLGTMGVYGYSSDFGVVPEGYLEVTVKSTGSLVEILYPPSPGSVYHMTKCLDALLFAFYNKNWGTAITDLHQGVVWGTETALTLADSALTNRFDYDGEYGTVLNRFLVQAAVGYPLTVYGSGGQTRAFININDTARCVALACETPPSDRGRVRVFNQVAEVFSVRQLAERVSSVLDVPIRELDNPRKERATNDLSVSNSGLRSLGFEPKLLTDGLLLEVETTVEKYKTRIDKQVILSRAKW